MSESSPLLALQKIYGGPEVRGMGSSVTSVALGAGQSLEAAAKQQYQTFCGEIWKRFGPENWLGQWSEVYRRAAGQPGDILRELRELTDHTAALAASMILDNIDEAEVAHAALASVFNDPAIKQLSIFRLGDGEAYSGVLIAAQTSDSASASLLTFLMD